MKTTILKSSFLFLACLLFYNNLLAQEHKKNKQERIEQKKNKQLTNFKTTRQAILDTCFIVKIDRINYRPYKVGSFRHFTPYSTTVSNRLNFMKVEKKKILVQEVRDRIFFRIPNGLGGITIEGKVKNYRIKEKGNRIFLTFIMNHRYGSSRFTISLNGSNEAIINGVAYGTVEPDDDSLIEGFPL